MDHRLGILAMLIIQATAVAEGANEKYTQYLLNQDQTLMVKLTFNLAKMELTECRVYETRDVISQQLSTENVTDVQVVRDRVLHESSTICNLANNYSIGEISFQSITFPGTKWCGIGNGAAAYGDLGPNAKADKCCREHDSCDDVIKMGETKYGLLNDGIGTISHCRCNAVLYHCLQNNDDEISDIIGILFFNVIKMKCFMSEHPILKCMKYHGDVNGTCQKYQVDRTKPKTVQFFDPIYFVSTI